MVKIDGERVREQMLKDGEWNISFQINLEILYELLNYYSKIPAIYLPFFLFKDKMVMATKSMDNIQYTEVVVGLGAMTDYDCGLGKAENSNVYGNTVIGDRFMDMALGTTAEEKVKENDVENDVEKLEGMDGKDGIEGLEEVVGKEGDFYAELANPCYCIASDNDFGSECIGFVIDSKKLEILIMDIKKFKSRDELIHVKIDTKSKMRMELHLQYVTLWIAIGKLDKNLLESTIKVHELIKNVRNDPKIVKGVVVIEPMAFAHLCYLYNKSNEDAANILDITADPLEGLTIYATCDNKGFEYRVKVNTYKYVIEEQQRKRDELEKKKEELSRRVRQLANTMELEESKEEKEFKRDGSNFVLSAIGVRSTVTITFEYIIPYNIKALSPITIEVRTDKPIILERAAFNDIKILLSVAPRVEQEEEIEVGK